jgi:aminopeptidase
MRDPRVERLADLITGYSLDVREGQTMRIDAEESAIPLVAALYRSALRRGALPYVHVTPAGVDEILLFEGSEEQLAHIAEADRLQSDEADAWVTIWSQSNTRALTRADPERRRIHLSAQYRLVNRRWQRIGLGELALCGMLFPTQAHAQDAEMSLSDYEDFVYGACHVDEDDPSAHWRLVAASLRRHADNLESVRELRIVGPDTDLIVGVDGRKWIAADGRFNMPDGEVFTSPVETETEGEIRYTFPAIYHGREVEDVRLRFEGGRVVAAEAARGSDYLSSLLDMDEGARVLGEVAFGLNYEIDRFTRNILFDEKIGGTMHLALGSAFPQAGGSNTSGLHWDMICDLRAEGEVYADGELIWKAGRFLGDAATTPAEPAGAAERG